MATKKLTTEQKNFIRKHPVLTVLLVIAILVGAFILKPWENMDPTVISFSEEAEGKLMVHYIDVGQADSILIQMPTGENVLIDAGASNDNDVRAEKGASYLLNYLKSCGVETIDYLFLTHPHTDHIASADEVIKEYGTKIGSIVLSDDTSSGWSPVAKAMTSAGVGYEICEVGDVYTVGDAKITVLGPVDSSIFDEGERNHYSIVCRLVYGDTSFLFTGDAETETEKAILSYFPASKIKSDVLKVGHHGSTTSSSDAFLTAVDPDIAVICVGSENSYGHPHDKIITRLEKHECEILRTDEEGTIILLSDGSSVSRLSSGS